MQRPHGVCPRWSGGRAAGEGSAPVAVGVPSDPRQSSGDGPDRDGRAHPVQERPLVGEVSLGIGPAQGVGHGGESASCGATNALMGDAGASLDALVRWERLRELLGDLPLGLRQQPQGANQRASRAVRPPELLIAACWTHSLPDRRHARSSLACASRARHVKSIECLLIGALHARPHRPAIDAASSCMHLSDASRRIHAAPGRAAPPHCSRPHARSPAIPPA